MRELFTRRPGRVLAAALLAVAAAAALGASQATASGAGPRYPVRPASPPLGGTLMAVTATSPGNAWAVGFVPGPHPLTKATLIEHWNGTTWQRVPSPSPPGSPYLDAVTATSAGDAWAVGVTSTYGGTGLIEHWNGRTWQQVPSPTLRGGLFGVAATSAGNAWAVGGYVPPHSQVGRPLIEHWNGRAWAQVATPPLAGNTGFAVGLYAIAATSASDAWAVGSSARTAGSLTDRPLIEHWNGRAWARVFDPGTPGSSLRGVAAVSSTSVWAVGGYYPTALSVGKTVIEHWDGRRWLLVRGAAVPAGSYLFSVTASSSCAAWATGATGPENGPSATLTERWDGAAWRVVASPTPGGYAGLVGVAETSACRPWAVGGYYTTRNWTLIEHWTGTAWQRVQG